jgi:carbonic anhydrase/acetyltransferase-like protein (isoleucine patch superfamily)
VNRFLLLFAFLLSAGSVFSQTPEVFVARANQDPDHRWQDSVNSNRFTVWSSSNPGDCANLSRANANTALNELERIYDVFVHRDGFPAPYSASTPANQRWKMGVYVLRNGNNCTNAPSSSCGGRPCCGGNTTCAEGHAFGGVIGGAPGMWLSSDAVNDRWALAHEFMHGLQIRAGGMAGGNTNQGTNFRGWFFESHANLTPHQVYPNDVHYCAEMYTRMANLYYGSTRNRYCNWHFFEYINHRFGPKAVNDLWTSAQSGANHDPFTELMHRNSISQSEFGDIFGDFALRAVIWDINRFGPNNTPSVFPDPAYAARGSARFRDFFNRSLGNPDEMFKRPRYTYLESLDSTDGANGRFVVPFATAPQRYGYNIIRLYPEPGANTITVRFRGDVQTQNNISNYTKNLNLEPAATHLPDNPGSDWRYGLVAVTGDANARTGTVTARYSEIRRAVNNGVLTQPDVSIDIRNNETQFYLVVAATPTIHHRITWDQFYYTVYRFPYMVEINGARPEGFQPISNPAGGPHANGGGFVANAANVAATAFVGPNARVLGGTVSNNARIEDFAIVRGGTVRDNARVRGRAVVRGGTIRDNAVVRDYALVVNGTISDRAVIADGANIYNAQVSGDARVEGAPNISNANARISGNAVVGGVCWIRDPLNLSGTAQILGDGEIYNVTATSGIYYGLVDAGVINNNQFGGNRTTRPTEVTAPRSMRWYGEDNTTQARHTAAVSGRSFNMNNRGVFTYNLDNNINAQLKIFDARGRLLRTIPLTGTQGTINTQTTAAQVLFWRVESNGKLIGSMGRNTVVR